MSAVPTNSQPERDPQHVVTALSVACRAHPDQRVMQVVVNALGADPFYVEDKFAAALLFEYAQKTYVRGPR